MHVDLDCFFVSVSLLKHPEREALKGQPVAVTHARNDYQNISDSSTDISSCNYEAWELSEYLWHVYKTGSEIVSWSENDSIRFWGIQSILKMFLWNSRKWADELQAVSCDEGLYWRQCLWTWSRDRSRRNQKGNQGKMRNWCFYRNRSKSAP